MSRWSFEPILESYALIAGTCVLLLLIVFIVRPWPREGAARNVLGKKGDRPADSTKSRRNRILMSLRLAIVILLALAMLRPSHVSTERQPQSSTLVMLVDQSRSINVQDLAGGKSRWQGVLETLNASGRALADFDSTIELRAYAFDESLHELSVNEGKWQLPAKATGEQTDLANGLRETLQRETGKRIAGVVLLSDGAQRVYQPRYDMQQSARELMRLNAPLYTVPFGKRRDQAQARDVAIERLSDQYTVFVKNELEIRGSLRIQGYVNQPIPVRVEIEGPNGVQRQTLGPIPVVSTADDSVVDFAFAYTPQEPGSYRLNVTAAQQEGELVTSNNQMTAYLTALDGGIRILYLEGNTVGPEQQILRRSLSRSSDIELDYRPISPLRRQQWPIDLGDLFDRQPYDIVVIGDVDSTALGTKNLQRIATLVVERGGGLMMTGGVNTLGPGGYRNTPIAPLLPMELGQFDRQDFGADKPVRKDLHLAGPLKMVPTPGRPHFITHLAAGEAENLNAWQRLNATPLLGANRLEPLRRNAIRLAETPNGDPLLVARQFAPGRVLVFAADSTHLWWRNGQQEAHKRFWRQAMLWLANQDEILRRDVWVQLERRRFRPGETITFRAGAKAENGDTLDDAELTATVQRNGKPLRDVGLIRDGDRWTGELRGLEDPGEYTLEVSATQQGNSVGKAIARFQVETIDLELADPAANPQQLAMLSAITKEAGGRSVPAEQLNELLSEIRKRPPEIKIAVQTKWRFGDRNQESWPYFLVFVFLIGTEWYLRKKWGLA